MGRITLKMWFLRTVLGFAFLTGVFPISHMSSMQIKHMPMPSQEIILDGAISTQQNLPTPCCNDLASSSSSICGSFVISDSACAAHSAKTQRISFATFSVQINHCPIVTPPPKI